VSRVMGSALAQIGDDGSEFAPVVLLGGSFRATPRMRLDGVENPISDGFPAL
jgi:hypothetical protein